MNNKVEQHTLDFFDFVKASPTHFHVVNESETMLCQAGFIKLNEKETWNIELGKRYYVMRNNSSILAFVTGTNTLWHHGANLMFAHTDSPCWHIKSLQTLTKNALTYCQTEAYGGSIYSTWLDRPLTIAGKVIVNKHNPTTKIIELKHSKAIFTNLAIHLNREINNGFAYNVEEHFLAFLTSASAQKSHEDYLKTIIAEELELELNDILQADLYLVNNDNQCFIDKNKTLFSSPRIDNLSSCYAIIKNLCTTSIKDKWQIGVLFNHEEVGSLSYEGANSQFVENILQRVNYSLQGNIETYYQTLAKSIGLSIDVAHAYNPLYANKYSEKTSPLINEGVAVKYHAGTNYSTCIEGDTIIHLIAEKNNIPLQKFIIRSNINCGQTIASVMASRLNMRVIDLGIPILAMHSSVETAGTKDLFELNLLLNKFIHN